MLVFLFRTGLNVTRQSYALFWKSQIFSVPFSLSFAMHLQKWSVKVVFYRIFGCGKPHFFAPVFALAGQVGEGVAFCPQCGEGIFASRACYARIHDFSIFAFTSSPDYCNGLNCRSLGVKASPELPSPISGSGERKSTIGGEGRKG